MNRTGFFCSMAIWAVLLPPEMFADLTIVQEVVMSQAGSQETAREMTFYVSGQKTRVEQGEGGMIFLGAEKKNIVLMHPNKTYMIMPTLDASAIAKGAHSSASRDAENMTWEKTGKKETIAGIEAEQWLGKSGGKTAIEVWSGGKPEVLEEFITSAGSIAKGPAAELAKNLKKGAGSWPQGYPLKTIVYNDGGVIVATTTVKKIDAGPVSPSQFEIPAGYSEMKMPFGAGQPLGSGGE